MVSAIKALVCTLMAAFVLVPDPQPNAPDHVTYSIVLLIWIVGWVGGVMYFLNKD